MQQDMAELVSEKAAQPAVGRVSVESSVPIQANVDLGKVDGVWAVTLVEVLDAADGKHLGNRRD